MPCADNVWATICTLSRSASYTAARRVSTSYCGIRGFAVGVNMPPVAIILMARAPSLTCRRIACTTCSLVSASVPKNQQWPEVMVIGVPAQISLGPGMAPDSMPFRMENETSLRAPISRTVVVPLIRMRRMALVARMSSLSGFSVRASSCALGPAEQCMWQCASHRPGRSETSPRSRTV